MSLNSKEKNKKLKCVHEIKSIICTYSLCESRGFNCLECIKENHISHINYCIDKNAIIYNKENSDEKEKRKKIISEMCKKFIEELNEIKKIIDKKIKKLKSFNEIEINEIFDLEKYDIFQIITKYVGKDKMFKIDYNKIVERYADIYINSLIEINDIYQNKLKSSIDYLSKFNNIIYLDKIEKVSYNKSLEIIKNECQEINVKALTDFYITDVGVFGYNKNCLQNNNFEKKNELFDDKNKSFDSENTINLNNNNPFNNNIIKNKNNNINNNIFANLNNNNSLFEKNDKKSIFEKRKENDNLYNSNSFINKKTKKINDNIFNNN